MGIDCEMYDRPVKYHCDDELLERLKRVVEDWGREVDVAYKDFTVPSRLDKYTFHEWGINLLYPASMVYCPLPLGMGGKNHVTKNDSEARGWLDESPPSHAPLLPNGRRFPVSHFGVYLVDLDPPANHSRLVTCVIPRLGGGRLSWKDFTPLREELVDSYTLWTA